MRKKLIIKFSLCLVLMLSSASLQSAGREKSTRIDGRANIKLNVGNVKNILSNSTRSQGQINIGNIKKSNIRGNVNLNRINIGNVTNILSNSRNSSAKISIGSIQNVIAKDIDIAVNVKNVKNKVNGGSNNHSTINIGSLKNLKSTGRINVDVDIRGEVASC